MDRLGSWYKAPKYQKTTPADRVTAIMAPKLGVTGSRGMDKIGGAMKDAPKNGNRLFKRGGMVKRMPLDPNSDKYLTAQEIQELADMGVHVPIPFNGMPKKTAMHRRLLSPNPASIPQEVGWMGGWGLKKRRRGRGIGGLPSIYDEPAPPGGPSAGKPAPTPTVAPAPVAAPAARVGGPSKAMIDEAAAKAMETAKMKQAEIIKQRERQAEAAKGEVKRRSEEDVKEEMRKATEAAVNALPEHYRNEWNKPIPHGFSKTVTELLRNAPMGTYEEWSKYEKEQGRNPTEMGYRAERVQKKMKQDALNDKYSGIGGFFKGVVDAWATAGPKALGDAINIIGRVIPGASAVTDKIEDKLNPNHEKHSWEELGGPAEAVINGAVSAAKKGVEVAKGSGVDKVKRLLPQETKVGKTKGNGMVYPIPDIKLQPELAQMIAMMKGGSPLDKDSKESLSNLAKHQASLVHNFINKNRKLPGLNLRRKITKGGRTFTSMKNILVTPEAAP